MIRTNVDSLQRIRFQQFADDGVLTVFAEGEAGGVPFPIRRVFTISDVSAGGRRGNHAHRRCRQLVVCLSGRARLHVDDGTRQVQLELKADGGGVLVPVLLWNTVEFADPGTTVAVFCDEDYDPADYLRDRAEYLALKRG